MLPLGNGGVARSRWWSFYGCHPTRKWEAATAKLMSVLPGSSHAASTQCVLHEGYANKRRYAGVGGKFLFVPRVGRFLPDLVT